MKVSYFLFASVSCFVTALTPRTLAQDSAAAEALFRSAREAGEQGDWVTACDRFEESKRLEPAPGTVLNLARCREKLGQVASAWKSYAEAAQRLPVRDERHSFAKNKAMELESRVPHVTLDAPETDEPFFVSVDGTRLSSASFGVPLPFDPGELEVVVEADGHETTISRIVLEEGAKVTHQLELGEPVEPGSSSVRFDASPASASSKSGALPFFVVGGVGAAAAIAGGVWAGLELPRVRDEDNCVDGVCNDTGAAAAERGRIAVYTLGVGSILAVGGFGVGAYLLGKKNEPRMSVVPLQGGGAVIWRTEL